MSDLDALRAEVEKLRDKADEGFMNADTPQGHIGFAVATAAYKTVLDLIDKHREGQERPPIGLMQVLPDSHPLAKYGSWENVPEDERWRRPADDRRP